MTNSASRLDDPRARPDAHAAAPAEAAVWDRCVRVLHWTGVGLFVVAFVTAGEFEAAHQAAGYGLLASTVLRVGWGFVGPRPARFSSFVRGPRAVLDFLRRTAALKAPRHLGHNPAGGAMVVALLAMLGLVTLSGAMQTLEAFADAPWLDDLLGDLHEGAVLVTLGLVALHLIGVLIASLEHDENLVRAMFTGRKRKMEE